MKTSIKGRFATTMSTYGLSGLRLDEIVVKLSERTVAPFVLKECDPVEYVKENVASFLFKKGGTYYAGINENLYPQRKRMAVAHLIAHYLLHRTKMPETGVIMDRESFWYELTGNRLPANEDVPESVKKFEREASDFAFELLMPEDEIRGKSEEMKNSRGFVDVYDLTTEYGLSSTAVSYRLFQLGIL